MVYTEYAMLRYELLRNYLGELIGYRKMLPPLKGKNILDVGSGNGIGLKVLKSYGGNLLGIENSEESILKAIELGHREEEFLLMDANHLVNRFGTSYFDLVTAFHAPLYDSQWRRIIGEQCTTVLRSGGYLWVTVGTEYEAKILEQLLEGKISGEVKEHPEMLLNDNFIYFGQKRRAPREFLKDEWTGGYFTK